MNDKVPDRKSLSALSALQRNEITEYEIYRNLAATTRDNHNRQVLERISAEEYEHYLLWKYYTGRNVAPDMIRVLYYNLLARTLGLTFTIKLMEGIEERAQGAYRQIGNRFPEVNEILLHEESHERDLIGMIDEERLRYMGSVVLGLNDALVEFTGSLAGFTFALQNTRVIAMAGLIMGVAASLSMAASEYLSQRSDGGESGTDPIKASLYTGLAYGITVLLLVLPFLVVDNPYIALPLTLAAAVLVISLFTFYISVARDLPFRQRFTEMATISLGIAAVSFVIGMFIRLFLGVDI